MKKIALFICMACVAFSMSAQSITGRSRIYLQSAGEADKDVRLLLSTSFSNDWDQTWDATPAQDGGIYVYYQSAKYSIWASNEYSKNLALAFDANDNTEYTLHFTSFLGATYKIKDLVADQEFEVNGSTADYVFTIDASLRNTSILDRFVINYDPALVSAQLNAYGLATFSFNQPVVPAESGLKMYKGALSGETLALTQVDYVKADEGVILYGQPNTTYNFIAGAGSADFAGNELKPASEWINRTGTIYVLSGSSLYIYEGENMKPNKAYLELPASAPAPERIRLSFGEATAFDNVEAEAVKAVKFVENGQIYIRRGNEVYNLQGQIVK